MSILLGLVLLFASIAGGYVLEHGNLLVLVQPAELLIIGGSAVGSLLIANPPRTLRRMRTRFRDLQNPQLTSSDVLQSLKLLYTLFAAGRRGGIGSIEAHVENPKQSEIFTGYPALSKDTELVAFICDSFRMAISAGVDPDELEQIMIHDIHAQRAERHQPVKALATIADSLPGLGIVAAVLGVVVTMQSLGGPAADVGQKVAAALVGTFLGILLCYGIFGPISARLDAINKSRLEQLEIVRAGIIAYLKGSSPLVAIEFARRSTPGDLRPSFDTLEQELRRNTKLPSLESLPARV